MTNAEHLAIILGRFATRPDAYKATRAHPRFGEALRHTERAYPMAPMHTDAGRRREEEIDAVIVAFILAGGADADGGDTLDRSRRAPQRHEPHWLAAESVTTAMRHQQPDGLSVAATMIATDLSEHHVKVVRRHVRVPGSYREEWSADETQVRLWPEKSPEKSSSYISPDAAT